MEKYETRSMVNNHGNELVFEYQKDGNTVDIDIYENGKLSTFTMSKKQLEELIEIAKEVRMSVFE